MSNYRYKIGEKVFIRGAARIDASRGAYEFLERLPAQIDQLRYLIRSCTTTITKRSLTKATWPKLIPAFFFYASAKRKNKTPEWG
jgi:hypothetical protein